MPALLVQPSAQLIGVNTQELANQIQMAVRPHLKLAFDFSTTDAAVLFTVPALTNGASAIKLDSLFWEITTSFTGGSSSAIGISSSSALYNTKGDLLGGASGDLAAALVSTGGNLKSGTAGTKVVSTVKNFLVAGDTIRFDRIASAFTAGAGFLHVDVTYLG